MERITPQIKAIADAHLEEKKRGHYDNPKVYSNNEVLDKMLEGYTFSKVVDEIEIRYMSITTQLMGATIFGHISDGYKRDFYKGFKEIFSNINYRKKNEIVNEGEKITKKKKIHNALYVMECEECGNYAASASEKMYLPMYIHCRKCTPMKTFNEFKNRC